MVYLAQAWVGLISNQLRGQAHGNGYLSNQQASSWGFSEAQAWDSGMGVG